jgi:hypothetical protein
MANGAKKDPVARVATVATTQTMEYEADRVFAAAHAKLATLFVRDSCPVLFRRISG